MNTSPKVQDSQSFSERFAASLARAWTTSFRPAKPGPRYGQPLLRFNAVTVTFFVVVATATAVLFAYYDEAISRWVLERATYGSSFRQFFLLLTSLGSSAWILILSGFIALTLSTFLTPSIPFRRRSWWRGIQGDATFLFWSVAISGTSASLIKNTIGRARPRYLEELGPHAFDFAAFTSGFASFPSGHSTTFGALCMALYLLFPRWGIALLAIAIAGGASRVVVGAHYASDVVAGLSFGALFTLIIARWLAQRGSLFDFTQGPFPKRKRRS